MEWSLSATDDAAGPEIANRDGVRRRLAPEENPANCLRLAVVVDLRRHPRRFNGGVNEAFEVTVYRVESSDFNEIGGDVGRRASLKQ